MSARYLLTIFFTSTSCLYFPVLTDDCNSESSYWNFDSVYWHDNYRLQQPSRPYHLRISMVTLSWPHPLIVSIPWAILVVQWRDDEELAWPTKLYHPKCPPQFSHTIQIYLKCFHYIRSCKVHLYIWIFKNLLFNKNFLLTDWWSALWHITVCTMHFS